MKQRLTRAFVVAWLVLGVAGALNHTVLDGRLALGLPHLQYGYVMFNKNPTRVPVFTYAHRDGQRRHLADLDPRPAPGYARARAAVDATLAPLARALVRSQVSGASVVQAVERLADELERESLARAEDAARRVGVAAAVPLGVCLLPAFMLLGVVPTVASLFGSVAP